MADNNVLMKVNSVSKIYQMGEVTVPAIKSIDLEVYRGEFIVILGPSGSGKSTLLNIIGGMDLPTEGRITMDDEDIIDFDDKEMTYYRRDRIGFVFQFYNLMGTLTAKENVELATEICKNPLDVDEVLELVGLGDRKDHFPSQMSGGEQQRVAIAIALANNPKLLLADEPTGSVDRRTANYILDVFRNLNKEMNLTIVIVTHDTTLSKMVHRVVAIKDGRTSSERIIKEKYAIDLDNTEINWGEEVKEDTHEEYSVIDRVGRLQIPRELLDTLNLEHNKVKVEAEDDKIIITKP